MPQPMNRRRVVVVEAPVDDGTGHDSALAAALPILAKLTAALSLSDAASLAADLTGVPRKLLYAHALQARREDGGSDAA